MSPVILPNYLEMDVSTGTIIWLHLLRVRRSLHTLWPAAKLWMPIQLIVLSICASGSSSGLIWNSGLKYNQFIAMGADGTRYWDTGHISGCCGCNCCWGCWSCWGWCWSYCPRGWSATPLLYIIVFSFCFYKSYIFYVYVSIFSFYNILQSFVIPLLTLYCWRDPGCTPILCNSLCNTQFVGNVMRYTSNLGSTEYDWIYLMCKYRQNKK